MRTRVLVTGTGSFGVGEGIVHCLKMAGDRYELWAANMDEKASSLYECEHGVLLPIASDAEYVQVLRRFSQEHSIRFLIPGSEPELMAIAPHSESFAAFGCDVLANPETVVQIGANKYETYKFLKREELPTPESTLDLSESSAQALGWPVIMKPLSGGGSRNVHKILNAENLRERREAMQQLGEQVFLQEYVGAMNEEYTASALLDLKGHLIGSFAARRTLSGGATATVEVEDFPDIRSLAERVARALGARGPINIQLRMHHGKPTVFEINPRFSGSAPFRALAGFNEPDLMIQSVLLGRPVELPSRQHGLFGVRSFHESVYSLSAKASLLRPGA
ncbi:MAG: ATP-grasp domain-containing protein [bacterium]